MHDQLLHAIIESVPTPMMAEAVISGYRYIFEDADGGMDTAGARTPSMHEHGTVDSVGPGSHTVTMGPGKTGYDIDGVHVGWANPGGRYSSAVDSQDAFGAAYRKLISSKVNGLSNEDVSACAAVMGDFDGLWYYRYDNGTGNSNRRRASEKLRNFGSTVGMDDDTVEELSDEIEAIAVKHAKENGTEVSRETISAWFEQHGVKLTDEQLSEIVGMVHEKVKFYVDEEARLAKFAEKFGADTLRELTVTDQPYDNMPKDDATLKNLAYMAQRLDALRDATGLKISVNSCYRSPKVNAAVNGASTSAHLKGLAMDLTAGSEEANRALYKAIVDRVKPWDIDQVIMYNQEPHNKSSRIRFIHVGMNPEGGRHQLLFS